MGSELSCPCGARQDIDQETPKENNKDIIEEVMKGKLSKDQILFRSLLWNTRTTGNEWILDKCEELSVGVFLRQGATRQWYKGFLQVGEQFDASCNNKGNSE